MTSAYSGFRPLSSPNPPNISLGGKCTKSLMSAVLCVVFFIFLVFCVIVYVVYVRVVVMTVSYVTELRNVDWELHLLYSEGLVKPERESFLWAEVDRLEALIELES